MHQIRHHGGVDLFTPQIIGFVAVGVGSGVLSGLLGVGGATVSTPGVRALGATPIQAVGSTIPAVLPSAVVGAWRSARAGLVDWRVALTCGGAGAVAAVGGAFLSDAIDPRLLMVMTAAVLLWSGFTVLTSGRNAAPVDALDEELDDLLATADVTSGGGLAVAAPVVAAPAVLAGTVVVGAVGLAAGLVAGLLGLGGGVVMMPLFTGLLGMPVKRAVPTSLVAVALFSIPALAAHTFLGHVNWTIALALVVGVIPGARIGAHWNRTASDDAVRKLFGLFLVLLALIYGATEFDGLLAIIH